jgi:UDP-2-acetamido-2-deoxy-ribo-hexuluronate aminotransferase
MQNIQMVDLFTQYQKIKPEIDNAMQKVIEKSAFINGFAVKDFSENLAKYVGTKHVIPCANGTDALQIAFSALDLPKDAEFIVPSFNYVAAVEVGAFLGYKPVFVESLEGFYNIDVTKIEQAITPKTKVIVAVHLFGQCADMDAIMKIAKNHNLYVIEDTAQAIGAKYTMKNGEIHSAGTMAHIGTTSFFPSKNLGCMGDGGAIFTNDDELAKKMRCIANHGQEVKYTYKMVGINSRLDTLQASILDVKLKYLDNYIQNRQKCADFYDNFFKNHPKIQIPVRNPQSTHVFHQYTLTLDESINRNDLQKKLQEKGIPTMIYYPSPLHLQEAYQYLGWKKGTLPIAEKLSENVLSLPIHTEMNEEMLNYICENLIQILA